MAITIQQSPSDVNPAFNDNNWLVSSTNTAQPNFQFVADIYDTTPALVCRLKRPIEVGTTQGWFSIGRIIEAYLSSNFAHDGIISATNTNSYYRYYIRFGEEYGSTVTLYPNLTTSSTVYVWNAALKTFEFPVFDYTDYAFDSAAPTDGIFLTPIRGNYPTTLNQQGMLWMLQEITSPPDRIKVIAYDSAGATTTSIFTTGLTAASEANRLIRIPAHPVNLNGIVSLTTGTPGSVIPATTVYYTVQPFLGVANCGEVFRFDVKCESNFSNPVYLYWLNRFGGFDSFIFDAANKFSSSSIRKNYNKNHRTLSGSTYVYTAGAAGVTTHYTETQESATLVSRWLTSTEAELIDHLATSPLIYMLKDGVLTTMNLTKSSHQKKTADDWAAYQYEFEVSYALKDFSQRF